MVCFVVCVVVGTLCCDCVCLYLCCALLYFGVVCVVCVVWCGVVVVVEVCVCLCACVQVVTICQHKLKMTIT